MNLNPAALAIRYRRLAMILLLLFLGLGYFNFMTMPRQEDPDFNPAVASIGTVYPGATPQQVETLISKPLEEKINEMDNLQKVFSYSYAGYSSVFVELEEGTDTDKAWEELREKINLAEKQFPSDAKEPIVDTDLLKTVTTLVSLQGPALGTLEVMAKDLESQLEGLPLVASVDLIGLPEDEVQILVPAEKLAAYPISLNQLISTIKGNSSFLQSSNVETETSRYQLEVPNRPQKLEDLSNTIVYASPESYPVYLSDLANLKLAKEKREVFIRHNGQEALALSIFVKENQNVIDFGESVHKVIKDFQKKLPEDYKLTIIADQPTTVGDRLDLFTNTLLSGIGLVLVVVFLGLGWRNALVICLAIPISAMLAFTFTSAIDMKLHQVSIMGLVIALGMLVDNAIVVNDNIYTHYLQGRTIKEAAVTGVREVAIPIATSTLTTIAAFVPLMFIGGDIGAYIISIPQMVTFTLTASLVVAITFTPLFITYAIKKHRKGKGSSETKIDLNSRLVGIYQKMLLASLAKPKTTVALTCLILVVSIAMIPLLNTAFFPPAGRDLLVIEVETPQGTSIDGTKNTVEEVEGILGSYPEIKDYTTFLGVGMPKFFYNVFPSSGKNFSQILVNTVPKENTGKELPEVIKSLRKQFNEIAGARIEVMELEQGPPVGPPVNIRIVGPELAELEKIAAQVTDILKKTPGTLNPTHTLEARAYQLESIINKEKANLVGLSSYNVSQYLQALNEGTEVGNYYLQDEELDIKLFLTSDTRTNSSSGILQSIQQLPLYSELTGKHVILKSIAEFQPSWQPVSIQREDGTRYVNVNSYVEGVTSDQVLKEVLTKIDQQVQIPNGYTLETGGEFEEKAASFTSLARAGITAIVMIYLILVFQFNSLVQPLLIVTSIPFTLIGSILGLLVTNNPLGFMAFLGIVSLVGVVVNNAIVLVDFINMQRKAGVPLKDAIYQAAERRLRPVVLTTATTIGGLLPLSVTGGALWAPMGFVIVFGLLSSTILTLLMLPALYYLTEGYLESRRHNKLISERNNPARL